MKRRIIPGLLALICLPVASAQSQHWPSFRGPAASAVADRRPAPPTEWNVGEANSSVCLSHTPDPVNYSTNNTFKLRRVPAAGGSDAATQPEGVET
jgi:hypothetical protein